MDQHRSATQPELLRIVDFYRAASAIMSEYVVDANLAIVPISRESYISFLGELGAYLTSENVEVLKFRADFPAGQSERITNPLKYFTALERHRKMDEYSVLIHLTKELHEIQRHDVARKVNNFIKEVRPAQNKIGTSPVKKRNENLQAKMNHNRGKKATENKDKLKKPSDFGKKASMSATLNEEPTSQKDQDEMETASLKSSSTAVASVPCADEHNWETYSRGHSENLAAFDENEVSETMHEDFYRMESDPRGFCLILSIERFEGLTDNGETLENRDGSSVDAKSLKDSFKSLKFNVKEVPSPTYEQIKKTFHSYAEMSHTAYDCFVACILSHGTGEGFYSSDSKLVNFNDIVHDFKDNVTLKGKPKVFFSQHCRGENIDEVVHDGLVQSYKPSDNPSEADFYFAFATPPGYVSWRSQTQGSWFICSLCKWLHLKALHWTLDEIMTKVIGEVATFYTDKNHKQIPYVCTTLTKKLKFI